MRRLYTALAVLLVLSACAVQQQHFISFDSNKYPVDVEAVDISILITNDAWKSHEEEYIKGENHKAFAQSKSGSWGWRGGRTSAEFATLGALVGCRKHNKENERSQPCMIVKVGDKWGAELDLDR